MCSMSCFLYITIDRGIGAIKYSLAFFVFCHWISFALFFSFVFTRSFCYLSFHFASLLGDPTIHTQILTHNLGLNGQIDFPNVKFVP